MFDWKQLEDILRLWNDHGEHKKTGGFDVHTLSLCICSSNSRLASFSTCWQTSDKFRTADAKPSEKCFLIEKYQKRQDFIFVKKIKQCPSILETDIDQKTSMVV